MTNSAEIKAHLLALADKEIEPIDPRVGICSELAGACNLEDSVDEVCNRLMHWVEHSGNRAYPIPGGVKGYLLANRDGSGWNPDDECGAARLRACRWLSENWDTRF